MNEFNPADETQKCDPQEWSTAWTTSKRDFPIGYFVSSCCIWMHMIMCVFVTELDMHGESSVQLVRHSSVSGLGLGAVAAPRQVLLGPMPCH